MTGPWADLRLKALERDLDHGRLRTLPSGLRGGWGRNGADLRLIQSVQDVTRSALPLAISDKRAAMSLSRSAAACWYLIAA